MLHWPMKSWLGVSFSSPRLWVKKTQVLVCVCVCTLRGVQFFAAPPDCSPPGSTVHGISQARILEWVAISYSRGSSLLRD